MIDFIKEFPDEESCKSKFKFKAYREHVGVVCPKCGCRDHYWKRDKESYECKGCSYRQSLRSNTVMYKSKLPYRYVDLKEFVPRHNAQVILKEKVGEVLLWVHIAISNAKRQLLNTHHDIKPEFLQKYLDEFCYKFNRRYAGEALFNRLLVACVSYKNDFRYKYG